MPSVGQFVKAIATRPKIRDRVKTCWLEGDVCCGGQEMLDFISALKRLGSLQELGFQPVDTMEICGKIMLPSLQSILAGHVVGSLRALHIDLKNRDASGLHPVAQRDLLQRLFSIKSLKAITALYRARNDRQEDDVIRDPLPLMKTTKITDLQTLALQWDGLSLEWITALLQLPRSLKEFTLLFSPRWHSLLHTPPRPSMYLDDVLEPVLDSLQTFHLHAVGRGGPSTGWFDVKWSKRGLGAFRNLQELSISCQFLLSLHIDLESRRWFPLSLVKLQLTQLLLQLTEIYNCLTLDPTSVPLKLLSRQLDMLTRLRSVTVITENMKMEDLKKPPRVLLERSYQDLVNRAELKIFADVENGKHPLEFEVRD
ncbi:hypothetical protein BJY00DRAFT_295546 [Aspergillus carlsbadensis]|nr:hypothetical protein BJY00DRAFT_295546 [Aspergillus carlsbadensis]